MDSTKRNESPVSTVLEAALIYAEKFGFSVIPVKPDKKSYVKWEQFQRRQATREEIILWWQKWPSAMLGIVTGSISGVVVVDVDTAEGSEAIEEYLPDSIKIPTSRTPKGGRHLYFKHPGKTIGNNAKAVAGCDFRGDGGYVIAPPSVNAEGKRYDWLDGLSIHDVETPALPEAYIEYLFNNAFSFNRECDDNCRQESPLSSNVVKMFVQGRRDEDLFHIANLLVKAGGKPQEVSQVLEILALNCDPPFSIREVPEKIKSALQRAERRERNLTEDVREWVLSSSGVFLSSEVVKCLQVSSREEQKNLSKILSRLCDEGLIEKHGNRNGCFRIVENQADDIDWMNASTEAIHIKWPFQIEKYVKILPKNIIVVAGEPNAGKTAFLLNVIRMNMAKHPIYYFNSEMGGPELKERLSKFDLSLCEWKFAAKERSSDFGDVVNADGINIIDYLEMYDEFWKIGGFIRDIYVRLAKGIAIIAIQKNMNRDTGLGGERGLEKARLYLSMGHGKIKIIKGKGRANPQVNPNGLELDFKLVQGCEFMTDRDWHIGN